LKLSYNTFMSKVLFICEGNVGRSQIAEAYFNHFHKPNQAISAGIDDVGAKYNWHPREDIVAIMREDGMDISNHTIKQLKPTMLNNVDMVVALCSKEKCPGFLTKSESHIKFLEIEDPVDASLEHLRVIRNKIKALVLMLKFRNKSSD
jgi:arsenate reductase (thioredoxin)